MVTTGACTARVTSICEFFCYLMDATTYKTYYSTLTKDNPFTWGQDLILYYRLGLRTCLVDDFKIRHYYKHNANYEKSGRDSTKDMNKFLEGHQKAIMEQPFLLFTIAIPDASYPLLPREDSA